MRYLFDTHALVWWLLDVPRLSPRSRNVLKDPHNEIFVSAVSAFEISNKVRLGKWLEAEVLARDFPELVAAEGFSTINLTAPQAVKAGLLPGDHRDPFDRFLAAQSIMEDVPLITADPRMSEFGIETLW